MPPCICTRRLTVASPIANPLVAANTGAGLHEEIEPGAQVLRRDADASVADTQLHAVVMVARFDA